MTRGAWIIGICGALALAACNRDDHAYGEERDVDGTAKVPEAERRHGTTVGRDDRDLKKDDSDTVDHGGVLVPGQTDPNATAPDGGPKTPALMDPKNLRKPDVRPTPVDAPKPERRP